MTYAGILKRKNLLWQGWERIVMWEYVLLSNNEFGYSKLDCS